MEKLYTYLALGDSYTIGEALPLQKSFPFQVAQMLRKEKVHFAAPEIIAKTGWTTDELSSAISEHQFLKHYDFVTLLIGVNNQYRGREIEEYKMQFEELLANALHYAHGKQEHVFVISIPDYSVTAFAQTMDTAKISKEIDQYNTVNRALAAQYKVQYIDITPGSREAKTDLDLVTSDGLHPSEKEYQKWAEKLTEAIKPLLK